jgi:hypothetical protein
MENKLREFKQNIYGLVEEMAKGTSSLAGNYNTTSRSRERGIYAVRYTSNPTDSERVREKTMSAAILE